MIALMHEAVPYGHLIVSGQSPTDTQLAVLAGVSSEQVPDLIGELESAGVFSRTKEGVIYSRKMTRSAKKAAIARRNGKNGGNPSLRKSTDISSSDIQNSTDVVKPQKPEARIQKEDKPLAQHLEPAPAAPDRYDRLLDRLLEANGNRGFRAERDQGLIVVGPIIALVEAGLDLDRDILPAIKAKPKPDARAWSYFVPQIREFAQIRRSAVTISAAPGPDEDWGRRMQVFREDGVWTYAWGPKPGEAGCRVPRELLKDAA
jgi:hypothetical protein